MSNEDFNENDLLDAFMPETNEIAKVGKPAPDFTAMAVVNGEFKEVNLASYQGKNVVLFFWPLDFTFVCPTEVVAFSEATEKFAERDTVLLGVSTDSHFTHLAWQNTSRNEGGVGKIEFPMIADLSHEISWKYGVLLEEQGIALRGLFLIDPEGVVRHMVINDLPLGRSVTETLRMVDSLRHFEQNGEVCPADWHQGDDSIKPGVADSQEFFKDWGSEK